LPIVFNDESIVSFNSSHSSFPVKYDMENNSSIYYWSESEIQSWLESILINWKRLERIEENTITNVKKVFYENMDVVHYIYL